MANKISFSKKTLARLTAPLPGKRDIYTDVKTPGLRLFVTAAGTKSFYLHRRVQGQPEQILIGRYPDMDISRARDVAAELNAIIARGGNPQDLRRERLGELSVGDLFKEYMERHVQPYRKPRTAEDYQWQFNKHLAHWKRRRLSAITRRRVQALHAQIGRKHGEYIANRVLALLHAMFSKARAWGHFSGDNPAGAVQKFRERSRERFVQAEELPALFKSLSEELNTGARTAILLCLLTGARKNNVLAMRWTDVNLDRETWLIPTTKSGDAVLLPLVPAAVELLQARQLEVEESSPWVFPAKTKTGHIVDLRTVWSRVQERAELKDLRLHDLRRTLGSWQAAQGASLLLIGKSLGHRTTTATAIYSRLNLDPVRESVERATTAMLEAGGVLNKDKVTPIKKGGRR